MFGHAIDVAHFETVLGQFFAEQQAGAEVPARGSIALAVDGKTLRGTIPAGQSRGVHLVAAYLPHQGVVLARLALMAWLRRNPIPDLPAFASPSDHLLMACASAIAAADWALNASRWIWKAEPPQHPYDVTC